MPQLISTTTHSALPGILRWRYQAVFMNMFEPASSATGAAKDQLTKPAPARPPAKRSSLRA